MTNVIPERDWKYLSGIKSELLEALCKRINDEALRMVSDSSLSQHEKFLRLYTHIMQQNEVVAECFDDWRRSNILQKIVALRWRSLLTDEYISQLSAETRARLGLA